MWKTMCIAALATVLAAGCKKAEQQEAPAGADPKVVAVEDKKAEPARVENATEVPLISSSKEAIAELRQARALQDNIRGAEALEHMRKAVQLDPEFAQAHSDLAFAAPGDEAKQHLDKARALVDKLPEAARLDVETALAFADDDVKKARATCEKLAQLVPGDPRPQQCIGNTAVTVGDQAAAAAAFEKAIANNPKSAPNYNSLAYARMALRQYDAALTAIDKYAELAPGEPNPYDSKGEILLAAGRYPEAEQAFQQAFKVAPQFSVALQGVAYSRFLRGDWAGGRAALAEQKKAALDAREKAAATADTAMSFLVAGKPADALTQLDAAEKEMVEAKATVQHAGLPLLRAAVQIDTGKAAQALTSVDTALTRAKALQRADQISGLTRNALIYKIYAQFKLGKADDAAATLEAIKAEAAKNPDDLHAQADVHVGAGLVAWAKGDAAGAVKELSGCDDNELFCRWQLAMAQAKAGDKAGAAATRKSIRDGAKRGWQYLYIANRLPKE